MKSQTNLPVKICHLKVYSRLALKTAFLIFTFDICQFTVLGKEHMLLPAFHVPNCHVRPLVVLVNWTLFVGARTIKMRSLSLSLTMIKKNRMVMILIISSKNTQN